MGSVSDFWSWPDTILVGFVVGLATKLANDLIFDTISSVVAIKI